MGEATGRSLAHRWQPGHAPCALPLGVLWAGFTAHLRLSGACARHLCHPNSRLGLCPSAWSRNLVPRPLTKRRWLFFNGQVRGDWPPLRGEEQSIEFMLRLADFLDLECGKLVWGTELFHGDRNASGRNTRGKSQRRDAITTLSCGAQNPIRSSLQPCMRERPWQFPPWLKIERHSLFLICSF